MIPNLDRSEGRKRLLPEMTFVIITITNRRTYLPAVCLAG